MTFHQSMEWIPRALGLLVSLFIAAFALDAFAAGKPLPQAAADFAIHLIPGLVLLSIVIASWRREWIAGVTFILAALVYSTAIARGRVDWMLIIAVPLLGVGLLFLGSWFGRRAFHGDLTPTRDQGGDW